MNVRAFLVSAVASLGSIAGARAAPQCDEVVPGFHLPAMDDAITTVISGDLGDGEKLYFGGLFRTAGATPALRVARFDGVRFEALGNGLNREVTQLCVFDAGQGPELYAAGDFTMSGSVPMDGLARWNGTSWSGIGDVIGGEVLELEVVDFGSGPRLCVCGDFTSIGGVTGLGMALFDGASWTSAPLSGAGATAVRDVARMDDANGMRIYIVNQSGNIQSFNGTTWRSDTSVSGGLFTERSLTVFDDGQGPQLYVTGSGSVSALPFSMPHEGLARFDGVQWSALPGWFGTHTRATHAATVAGLPALYFLERNLGIGRWNGAQIQWIARWDQAYFWTAQLAEVSSGPAAGLWGCSSYDSLAGSFSTPTESSLARFDGANWTSYASPEPAVLPRKIGTELHALGVHDDGSGPALYTAGRLRGADADQSSAIARWNGAGWSLLPGRFTDIFDGVRSIVSYDDGGGSRLYVGGYFRINGVHLGLVVKWDGAQWSSVGSSFHTGGGGFAPIVNDMLEFDDGNGRSLFVAGDFYALGGAAGDYVARWNGTTWQGLPGLEGAVNDLHVHDDGSGPALYAAGKFLTIDGVSAPRIAKWNGASWSSVGGGVSMEVASMASFEGDLIVGGLDPFNSSTMNNNVRRWDGSTWTTIPNSPLGDVRALLARDTVRGRELVATGNFTTLEGGAPAPRLARFDGTSWSAFDVGLIKLGQSASQGLALALYDDGLQLHGTLYVAGDFRAAGEHASRSIVRIVDACECDATNYCSSGTTSNGCEPVITGLGRASASASSSFVLQASQLEGGRSGHIFYGVSGGMANPWGQSSHFLCVRPPSQRTGTQSTAGTPGQCDGAFALDWNAYVAANPAALGLPLAAGDQVWAQTYFRDPAGPKRTALSNALHFVICP